MCQDHCQGTPLGIWCAVFLTSHIGQPCRDPGAVSHNPVQGRNAGIKVPVKQQQASHLFITERIKPKLPGMSVQSTQDSFLLISSTLFLF